jgi:hypothetical protein
MKLPHPFIVIICLFCVSCSQAPSDIGGEVVFDMNQFCKHNGQCETPSEYLIRSSCPYTARCIEGGCYVVCPDFHECETDDYKNIEFSNETEKYLSPHEIVEEVFVRWLEYHRERRSCSLKWIEDFSVSEVQIDEVLPDRIGARVSFDILPTDGKENSWIAGNGVFDGEWIRGKNLFVTIGIEKNTYSILNLETGS